MRVIPMNDSVRQRFSIRDRSAVYSFDVFWSEGNSQWYMNINNADGTRLRSARSIKPFSRCLNIPGVNWDVYAVPKVCSKDRMLDNRNAWRDFDLLYTRLIELEYLLLPGTEDVLKT